MSVNDWDVLIEPVSTTVEIITPAPSVVDVEVTVNEVTVEPVVMLVEIAPVVPLVLEIPSRGLQGVPGPEGDPGADSTVPGPQGPAGAPGSAPQAYIHDQSSASATWTVVHNLGYYPNVTVVDSAGTKVVGSIDYTGLNTLEIRFTTSGGVPTPFGGKAYCS